MRRLFLLPGAVERDEDIESWFRDHDDELGAIAKHWFDVIRNCGDDIRETLHDGHPTACVGEAAFAYVNAFAAHVNVGFFAGSVLNDPAGILQGTGKFMRHVKINPDNFDDSPALIALIESAYYDMQRFAELEQSQE